MMAEFSEVAGQEHATGNIDYIKAVSDVDGEDAAMRRTIRVLRHGPIGCGGWSNRMTRLSDRELLTTDLAIGADFIGPTPPSSCAAPRRVLRPRCPRAYDRVDGPKG
ncbi:MAG: hypothetical protein R2704_09255 [Microthrixaceae bacterium]